MKKPEYCIVCLIMKNGSITVFVDKLALGKFSNL